MAHEAAVSCLTLDIDRDAVGLLYPRRSLLHADLKQIRGTGFGNLLERKVKLESLVVLDLSCDALGQGEGAPRELD